MNEPTPASLPDRQECFDVLTVELVRECMPRHLTSSATQELTDKLNSISTDPMFGRMIRENFISYSRVLGEGKFKAEEYLRAVIYVSYKLMGYNNDDAYIRTFPDRFQDMTERGIDRQTRSAYVAAYHRGKLVNLIMEQALIPAHVLFQDIHIESITTLASLMRTSGSERIQMESAQSLMLQLKPPETKEVNLNIRTAESEGMAELKGLLQGLAGRQVEAIQSGRTAKDIALQKLLTDDTAIDTAIDADFVEVDAHDTGS